MIKYIQINQNFDIARLQEEVTALEGALWKEHYNKKNYEGDWSTLQLRSINGNIENNVAVQDVSLRGSMAYKDTELLKKDTYLRSVIDFFEMEKFSIRLMRLNAGAVIKEHSDHDLNFEEGEVRFHIPVMTNPGVAFFIEDEQLYMQEGTCWYVNLSLRHRINNFGADNRIHLVIDGKVNDWVKDLFHSRALIKKVVADETNSSRYSAADAVRIIKELRAMNTPVADKLADDMEKSTA